MLIKFYTYISYKYVYMCITHYRINMVSTILIVKSHLVSGRITIRSAPINYIDVLPFRHIIVHTCVLLVISNIYSVINHDHSDCFTCTVVHIVHPKTQIIILFKDRRTDNIYII